MSKNWSYYRRHLLISGGRGLGTRVWSSSFDFVFLRFHSFSLVVKWTEFQWHIIQIFGASNVNTVQWIVEAGSVTANALVRILDVTMYIYVSSSCKIIFGKTIIKKFLVANSTYFCCTSNAGLLIFKPGVTSSRPVGSDNTLKMVDQSNIYLWNFVGFLPGQYLFGWLVPRDFGTGGQRGVISFSFRN